MRLKSIKLAGFKSFVDPTTVHFPKNLTAVVGPNGCGKSNIIDAVRWVMGESSAKTLRGESMTDVIFSGSNGRNPVGQASIELLFDNSDGKLGGEFSQYAEISIRRSVSRDLQSHYFLNGTRCRRRDIQDVFLGTGLGPRSYSIIEQGVISRFVEAKPDELRVYIEEAAGISKYKERRRETERRIRHTRENLERLNDIREELGRQLQNLQRQAKAAERYSEFKQEERDLKAELLGIRWRDLDNEAKSYDAQMQTLSVGLEAAIAEQRTIETDIEKCRQDHSGRSDHFNSVQADLYQVGTEIARYEQNINNHKERIGQLNDDLALTVRNWGEAQADMQADQQRLLQLQEDMATVEPELIKLSTLAETSGALLESVESRMQDWQQVWDEFQGKSADARQQAEIEQSRIQHQDQNIHLIQQRHNKLVEERKEFGDSVELEEIKKLKAEMTTLDAKLAENRKNVVDLVTHIEQQRDTNNQFNHDLDINRRELQERQGHYASMKALQEAALGQRDAPVLEWLEDHQLQTQPRLAEGITVAKGWQAAAEVVLGSQLQSVCVEDLDLVTDAVGRLKSGALTLLAKGASTTPAKDSGSNKSGLSLLSEKMSSDWAIGSLLEYIYVADDLIAAKEGLSDLPAGASVVTKEGIWLGHHWIRLRKDSAEAQSVLERQEELKGLETEIPEYEKSVDTLRGDLQTGVEKLKVAEQSREVAQRELDSLSRQHAGLASQLSARTARAEQLAVREERVNHDLDELARQLEEEQLRLVEARTRWQQCLEKIEHDSGRRESLLKERDVIRTALEDARRQGREDKDKAHEVALRKQSVMSQSEAANIGLQRLQSQVERLSQQQKGIEDSLNSSSAPMAGMETDLKQRLGAQLELNEKLAAARKEMEQAEQQLEGLNQARVKTERNVESARGQLEQSKLQNEGLKAQREAIVRQLEEMKRSVEDTVGSIEEEAQVEQWDQKLVKVQNRIQRLGPINLAAIDEYQTQSERKTYLDAQDEDLQEALDTLENAIRKIDRETRTRFKETFEQVNKGFQNIFPKVFGGGHATLELTGDDLLDTGVTVMARPPGKRNSTIHLLSGGEKALTAISMVFAIFQLNPAPFCMLDEVDAPLDDANVARFCKIVQEMSQTVQFIFITHNKVTMEMANHMMGVTMNEPGVSRLVSVDLEEAAAMVAS